jgi:acetyltransferase-like isoleucine patch superfamily enzyme
MPVSSFGERVAMIGMLLIGWYTPLHAAAVAACILAPELFATSWMWVPIGIALLYLFPPLAARTVMAAWGPTPSSATIGSRAFLRWWTLAQLQLVFNRLPQLEEVLRLVPGLYSAWLRLWGARVGRLVFWSPGVVITDRQLVEVSEGAIVGMGVTLAAHLVLRDGDTTTRVISAPVVVGAGAIVGGQAILGPGASIVSGETAHATVVLPPFWKWERGRRRRPAAHGRLDATVAPWRRA